MSASASWIQAYDDLAKENIKLKMELLAAKKDTQQVAKELMDAINEPMYSGSRDDWMHRAYSAENKLDDVTQLLKKEKEENIMNSVLIKRLMKEMEKLMEVIENQM